MTPRQIKEMKSTALAISAMILCAGLTYLAIEFNKHKSAHKLTRHAIIYQTFK